MGGAAGRGGGVELSFVARNVYKRSAGSWSCCGSRGRGRFGGELEGWLCERHSESELQRSWIWSVRQCVWFRMWKVRELELNLDWNCAVENVDWSWKERGEPGYQGLAQRLVFHRCCLVEKPWWCHRLKWVMLWRQRPCTPTRSCEKSRLMLWNAQLASPLVECWMLWVDAQWLGLMLRDLGSTLSTRGRSPGPLGRSSGALGWSSEPWDEVQGLGMKLKDGILSPSSFWRCAIEMKRASESECDLEN
jgi:hypothetical protein